MPLVRAEVRNEYGLGAPEMYRTASREEPKEILEAVAVAGLVGVLRQLGDLADFAAEVFQGLQEEVMMTSSRSHKLMGRVRRVEASLAPLEKAVLAQRSHLHFAYTEGCNWHAHIKCEREIFVYSDVPQFILDTYEDCRGPPRLNSLDRFDPSGPGSCFRKYSDPTFFRKASAAPSEASTQKVSADKNGCKLKKLKSWPRNGKISRGASFPHRSGSMKFTQRNAGGHTSPFQTMSTVRSDLSEQANLDLRNRSGYIKGDFRWSYSMQAREQEPRDFISSPVKRHDTDYLDYNFPEADVADARDDKQINLTQEQGGCSMTQEDGPCRKFESFSTKLEQETLGDNTINFETVDKKDVQTCDKSLPTFESGDNHLDEFGSEIDLFVDALNAIEPESNPISVSPKSSSAAGCSFRTVPSKDESNSLSPVDKALASAQMVRDSLNPHGPRNIGCHGNDDMVDVMNVESASSTVSSNFRNMRSRMPIIGDSRSSAEFQEHASTSNVISVAFWTNGNLLGLQPSKPPDCSLSNNLSPDPATKKDGKISSSSQHCVLSYKDPGTPDRTESFKYFEGCLNTDSSTCQEYQESGSTFRKICCKISPADLDIKFGRTVDSLLQTSSTGAGVIPAGGFLPVNPEFHPVRKVPENTKGSSRMSELNNRILTSNKKLLRDGDEISRHARYQNASHQNFDHRTFSGQTKDLFGGEPLIPSPSSPPLSHMKISFQPLDGFETSKLKLKFPNGNINDGSSRDIFPTFQLVPELPIDQQNDDSDSDDDTFCRSSPSLLDSCNSLQSESNSEQEFGESTHSKDPDLYDSLRRVSFTDSVPTDLENGRTSHGDINDNAGLQFPSVEDIMQNSHSHRSSDLQSLNTQNRSFQEELRNDSYSKDVVEPEFTTSSERPPLPPIQWLGVKCDLDDIEDMHEVMPKGSTYVVDPMLSPSTVPQQPKPAPFSHDEIFITTNEQKSKNSNGQREAKQGKKDEKEDFLQQIRTKSLNLRPTVTAKSAVRSENSANVQVTAILEKATAIRQAVGSDNGEDECNWSDTY